MEKTLAEKTSAAPTSGQSKDLMGAEILVKALQAENVKFVWGLPWWCSALHLRRHFQARHLQTRFSATRASSCARC